MVRRSLPIRRARRGARSPGSLLGGAALFVACSCSSPQTDPEAPGAGGGPATSASAAQSGTKPEDDETARHDRTGRERAAKELLRVIMETEMSLDQRGRMAMSGLAEPRFGLPSELRKVLAATSPRGSFDDAQFASIVLNDLGRSEKLRKALKNACGVALDEFKKELTATDKDQRASVVRTRCSTLSSIPNGELTVLHHAALVLSAVIENLLGQERWSSNYELRLARIVTLAYRSDK
jgi:hypothetical protein